MTMNIIEHVTHAGPDGMSAVDLAHATNLSVSRVMSGAAALQKAGKLKCLRTTGQDDALSLVYTIPTPKPTPTRNRLTPAQADQRVLAAIASGGYSHRGPVATALNVHYGTVERATNRLVEAGKLVVTGDRVLTYSIAPPQEPESHATSNLLVAFLMAAVILVALGASAATPQRSESVISGHAAYPQEPAIGPAPRP